MTTPDASSPTTAPTTTPTTAPNTSPNIAKSISWKHPRPKLKLTRFGLGFLLLIVVTLIGFTNYAITLGYALSFLLGGFGIVSAASLANTLKCWDISFDGSTEGKAGKPLRWGFNIDNPSHSSYTVQLRATFHRHRHEEPHDELCTTTGFVRARSSEALHFSVVPTRGILQVKDLELSVYDFLGLWQMSVALNEEAELLIYPAAEPQAPPAVAPLHAGENEHGHQRVRGQEDVAGLRPYQEGDAPRQISWKHVARTGKMITREFDAPQGKTMNLTWEATAAAGDHEARVSRLVAWVQTARTENATFSLTLPAPSVGALGAGHGDLHARKALKLLAELAPFGPPIQAQPQAQTAQTTKTELSTSSLPSHPALPPKPMQLTLLALGLTLLPSFVRQPIWYTVIVLGLLAYNYLLVEPQRRLPRPSLAIMLLILLLSGFLASLHYGSISILGQEAGTALLGILIMLKALESCTVRDSKTLILLGLFLAGSHFFFDQGPLTLLHVVLSVVCVLAAGGRWVAPRPELLRVGLFSRALFGHATRLLALGFPLAFLLFVIYPRPAGPMWKMPSQKSETGLGDEINAGAISDLAQSPAVAFRVDFEGEAPPNPELYWRGPVYEDYDGVRWKQGRGYRFAPPDVQLFGPVWKYNITMEPNGKPWLLALPLATGHPPNSFLTTAFQAMTIRPANARTVYRLESQRARLGLWEDPNRLRYNLEVPKAAVQSNPKAFRLAQSWLSQPPEKRVEEALKFFADGGFVYTLKPPTLPEQGRIDAFLYQSKKGFCEHYSAAFAFLMRVAQVPTRLVGGYQGAEQNPDGDYYIVRQKNAHAWTEVWLSGKGWTRVDPTEMVAPARLTLNLDTALDDPNGTTVKAKNSWERLMLRFDSWQNGWSNTVTGFDSTRQRELFAKIVSGLRRLPWWLAPLLVIVGAGIAFVRKWWLARAQLPSEPSARALYELQQRLGLPMQTGEPLNQYIVRAADLHPELLPTLKEFGQAYNRLRYSGKSGGDAEQAEQKALEQDLLKKVRLMRVKRK